LREIFRIIRLAEESRPQKMPIREALPVYTSGDWEIDLARREIRLLGVPKALGGRAFEIVESLVRSAGEIVDKNHVIHAVWPGATVEDNTLHVHIWAIRKALGRDRHLLKTIPGRGYKLLGQWTLRAANRERAPNGAERPSSAFLSNLPSSSTSLIGRSSALAHLVELLAAGRMITLTGPGGIGKTVLALETARYVRPAFQGAVCLVDLALVPNSAVVETAVASALNLKSEGDVSHASLSLAIGTRTALIIFDNCEHVIDAAARIAETILRACPKVRVLATSREVLRIGGEVVFRVSPLSIPDEDEQDPDLIVSCSAARLLIERARALVAGFKPSRQDVKAIRTICRRLDGIPLAIEIAAARVATLGLTEVSSHLDDKFGDLVSGRRTALPRHRTLRATLEWSYSLLNETERTTLRRLSIFAGSFGVCSATKIAKSAGADVTQISDLVASLAMKSLLIVRLETGGAQYRLLQTTRDFGLHLLVSSGEYDGLARSHAAYCCEEMAEAENDYHTLSDGQWLYRYGKRLDDVRSALRWSLDQGQDVELGATLTMLTVPLWIRLSLLGECSQAVRSALKQLGSSVGRASQRKMRLLAALANALMSTEGPTREAITAAEKARKIAVTIDDVDFQLRTIQTLWNGCFSKSELQKSARLASEFQQIAERSRNPSDELLGHRLYATSQFILGNLEVAQRHIERMLAGYSLFPHLSDFARFGVAQIASAHALLVSIYHYRGFPEQAIKMADECVAEALQTKSPLTVCSTVSSTCVATAILIGDYDSARRYTSIVLRHAERAGLTSWYEMGQCFEAVLQIKTGNVSAGLGALSKCLQKIDPSNIRYCYLFAELGEALARAGDVERGMAVVDRLLQGEQTQFEPELLRRKAMLTIMSGQPHAAGNARRLLRSALTKARRQGNRFFEMSVAVDLGALADYEAQRVAARDLLASLYAGFTEGFDTGLMVSARQTLDKLSTLGSPYLRQM
jgi:predicted ATPase/DNA-binding winged helix-turn-helix (wHTH) protein